MNITFSTGWENSLLLSFQQYQQTSEMNMHEQYFDSTNTFMQ